MKCYVITVIYYAIVFLRSVRRLLVTANVVPSSPILFTLLTEVHLFNSPKFRVLDAAYRE
jgi:hypothetical protein